MTTKIQYQPISISLPTTILEKIDLIAAESYKNRSDIIREALIERITPTYEPTKKEQQILDRAEKNIQSGKVTDWDTFVNQEL